MFRMIPKKIGGAYTGIWETVGSTFLYYLKMIETSTFQEKGKGSSRVFSFDFRVLSPLQELLSLDSYNVMDGCSWATSALWFYMQNWFDSMRWNLYETHIVNHMLELECPGLWSALQYGWVVDPIFTILDPRRWKTDLWQHGAQCGTSTI